MTPAGGNCRLVAAVCLAAAVVAAGIGCGGSDADTVDPGSADPASGLTLAEAQAPLKKATPELASLRDQANEILDEGVDGFDARLEELQAAGIPVVVNKWASWCGPCRQEFPHLQAEAIAHEDDVAFVGLLSDDGPETGATFLSAFPVPYPSYLDPSGDIASDRDIGREFPSTLFIDSTGAVAYTKIGPYTSAEDLAADIDNYAQ